MSKFVYSGVTTSITIDGSDYVLIPGKCLELPDDNEYVQRLRAAHQLHCAETAGKRTKTTKGEKK